VIDPFQIQHPLELSSTLAQNIPSLVPSDLGIGLFCRIGDFFSTGFGAGLL
jgi:hypothetical protein